jgi:tetratricopeptide (TPR) repeat protein
MRIAGFIGVKDEVELIAGAVRNLRQIGVEGIAVADLGSTDGTLDILKSFEKDHGFLLLHYDDIDPIYSDASAPQFRQFLARFNPDWVMLSDADERWMPVGGSIKAICGLHEQELLIVPRFNVVASPTSLARSATLGVDEGEFDIYVAGPPDVERSREAQLEVPAVQTEMWPRVIFRPQHVTGFKPGFHGVLSHQSLDMRISRDIFALHLPYTSRARFMRKLDNVKSYVIRSQPLKERGDPGHGWRRLGLLDSREERDREYDRQLISGEKLARLRSNARVVSSGGIFAHLQSGKDILPIMVQAIHLNEFGRKDEAVGVLRDIVAKDGSIAQAHWLLLSTLAELKRLDEAEQALADAMRLYENSILSGDPLHILAWGHARLGELFAKEKYFEKAEWFSRRATELRPLAPWYRQHSNILAQMGRREDALSSVNAAIEISPENSEYYAHQSALFLALGRNEEALSAADAGIRLSESNALLHYRSAEASKKLGRHAESVEALRRATKLDGENIDYRVSLVDSLIAAGEAAEALEILDRLRADPRAEGRNARLLNLTSRAIALVEG